MLRWCFSFVGGWFWVLGVYQWGALLWRWFELCRRASGFPAFWCGQLLGWWALSSGLRWLDCNRRLKGLLGLSVTGVSMVVECKYVSGLRFFFGFSFFIEEVSRLFVALHDCIKEGGVGGRAREREGQKGEQRPGAGLYRCVQTRAIMVQ